MNIERFDRPAHAGLFGKLGELVGSGDRIVLFTLPFLLIGVILNVALPSFFRVGGPSAALRLIAIAVLVIGVTIWAWSVFLILTRVPRGELVTIGPFAVVKHPLYTSMALLVLPALGILLNSWLGVVIGIVLYAGSRLFASAEEADLAKTFGATWDEYQKSVIVPWL